MVDARGAITVEGLRPPPIPATVKQALAKIEPGEPDGPAIDIDWASLELSPAERVFGWNTLEVLAFKTGNPEHPVNAIPAGARAHMQVRFVAGCDHTTFIPAIRAHLDECGFTQVKVAADRSETMAATRLDPDNPWVRWAAESIEASTGRAPAILPNLGGFIAERLLCRSPRLARRCGCHIPIQRVRSTHPMSICSATLQKKDCESWQACSSRCLDLSTLSDSRKKIGSRIQKLPKGVSLL